MNAQRKLFQVTAKALGERQVETIISTAAFGRPSAHGFPHPGSVKAWVSKLP